jgi:hypothetical protein
MVSRNILGYISLGIKSQVSPQQLSHGSGLSGLPRRDYIHSPGGDLASTGLMKELQRVQVQVPG